MTTVVAQEALAEIRSILLDRARRCKTPACVSRETVQEIIQARFGVSAQRSALIRDRIVETLVSEGILHFQGDKGEQVYKIVPGPFNSP